MTTRKPRRRPGVRIPTLREAYEQQSLLPFQMGHGPLPIIAFKDGPSKRYLAWLQDKTQRRTDSLNAAAFAIADPWMTLVIANPWHFPPPSHDWVPAAPGFPCRP